MESIRLHRVQHCILLLLSVSALSPLFVCQTGAVSADAPSSLQKELDRRCLQLYNEICKGGRKDFCEKELTPVARKGLGTVEQNTSIFRCYDITAVSGDTIDQSALGVQCVDDCGNLIPCKGTVKQALGSFHASRNEEILMWIEEAKPLYCSELQSKLDSTCNARATGSLGRILGSNLESGIACFSKENLHFESEGYCYNQCGLPRVCPGKPADGQPYAELNGTEIAQVLAGFQRPCKPFEKCTQVPGEAVECREAKEYHVEATDDLQHWLDVKCKDAVAEMCKTKHGNLEICKEDAVIVMRKGYGRSDQKTAQYRCYYAPKIEHTELVNTSPFGVRCVDNCGAEVLCGGTVNVESTMHSTITAISSWINEGKLLFCSAYQGALQSLCDKVFPGSLARYGVSPVVGSTPVDDSWSCVKAPLVVYEGRGMCLDGCARVANCAGGRQATGSTDSSLQRVLSHEEVEEALRDVVPPCEMTETCVASSRNPPQCEPVEYEVEAGGDTVAATMYLDDGDTLETTTSSLLVTVKIGGCFLAKVDLASQQVEVGGEERSTTISTAPATPPSKLSVHRGGDEVTLTLLYNMGADSRNSLFYVQPHAPCVATEPVVFEGLEAEARISRSSTKSISSSIQ